MVKGGLTHALGDIDYSVARKYVQRSTHEPEWSLCSAFQWRLVANIQGNIEKNNWTLEEFLKDHITLNQQSRIWALRVMLQMNFSDVCQDIERWIGDHDNDGVSVHSASVQPLLILHIVGSLGLARGTESFCKEAGEVRYNSG
jgi:hypothetical protein